MSWDEEKILEGVIKKKLTLESFYGSKKAGNIKAVIKNADNIDNEEVSTLPYGEEKVAQYKLPYIPTVHAKYGNDFHIMGFESNTEQRRSHYVFRNKKWTKLPAMPMLLTRGAACEYDGDLHILSIESDNNTHYVYNKEINSYTLMKQSTGLYSLINYTQSSWNISYVDFNDGFIYIMTIPAPYAAGSSPFQYPFTKYDLTNKTGSALAKVRVRIPTVSSTYVLGGNRTFLKDDTYMYMVGGDITRPDVAEWSRENGYASVGINRYDKQTNAWIDYTDVHMENNRINMGVGIIGMVRTDTVYIIDNNKIKSVNTVPSTSQQPADTGLYVPDSSNNVLTRCIITDDGNIHYATHNGVHAVINKNDLLSMTINKYWNIGPEYSLLYDYSNGDAVVYDNAIHVMGNLSRTVRQDPSLVSYSLHSKYDGISWSMDTQLDNIFTNGSAVIYNNEIHLLGSSDAIDYKKHVKYNRRDDTWDDVSTLPINFYNGCAVVLSDGIHILGGAGSPTAHYVYNGTEWTASVPLPNSFVNGCAVVYNDEIHVLFGLYHLVFRDGAWINDVAVPYSLVSGSAVVYHGSIHILGGTNNLTSHKKFDGEQWSNVSTLPYNFQNGSAIVYNDEIYIMGTAENYYDNRFFYKWSDIYNEWRTAENNLMLINHSALTVGNSIHLLGGNDAEDAAKHYEWNGLTWTEHADLPYEFSAGSAQLINNEIHIFGGINNPVNHYKLQDGEWSQVSSLPYNFMYGSSLLLNGELHILGSSDVNNKRSHYKWNGFTWDEVSELPFDFYNGIAFVSKGTIHIIGGSANPRRHYRYENSAWIREKDLTVDIVGASGIMFNNEIHIFGELIHSKLVDNVSSIENDAKLPYAFRNGALALLDDEIHMLGGGSNKHYKFFDPGVKPVKLEDVEIYIY